MPLDLIAVIALFALTMTGTPGPNNVMLMASGANFGYVRSIPHILGITSGLASMILAVGLGLNTVFEAAPILKHILTVFCAGFLLYMAWKIAHASAPGEGQTKSSPMTVFQAAAFQWINPKSWIMVLTAITLYAESASLGAVVLVMVVFATVGPVTNTIWVMSGVQIRRVLTNPTRLKVFNWIMASFLVCSLYPMVMEYI